MPATASSSPAVRIPVVRGPQCVEKLVVGGWNFNTIFQMQAGSPFAAINASTTAQSLTFRPNQTCDPNLGGGHVAGTLPTQHYFNTSCFALPTTVMDGVTLVEQQPERKCDPQLGAGAGIQHH